MLKSHPKWLVAGVIALASFFATPAQGGTIVVPNSLAAVEGNSNNLLLDANRPPLPPTATDSRIQQIFAASQFGGSTVTITGISVRPDGLLGTVMPNTTYEFTVVTATTSATDFVIGGYANNLALTSNQQTVLNQQNVTVSSSNTGPVGGPKAFDIFIPFTSNYVYNPASGNLFLDITTLATTLSPITPTIVDAYTDSSNISNAGTVGASGTPRNIGLVVQFQTLESPSAIPEPGTMTLFGLGVVGLVGAMRRRARQGAEAPEETAGDCATPD